MEAQLGPWALPLSWAPEGARLREIARDRTEIVVKRSLRPRRVNRANSSPTWTKKLACGLL